MSSFDVKIVVDRGELRSGVPDALRALGAMVDVATLPVADYLLGDGIGVERKTVADLHRSIAIGRLWTQLLSCRRTLDRTYLVVEGSSLDAGCVTPVGVRGALLEIADRGVTVIRSTDPEDTATWLLRISIRLHRRPSASPRTRRFPRVGSPSGLLSEIPGIGPRTAGLLLDRFGSVQAIADAGVSELERVKGIGPQRAAVLMRILSEGP
jgi:ERCC4-type nuclease